jgi:Tol biopolymer transport system component
MPLMTSRRRPAAALLAAAFFVPLGISAPAGAATDPIIQANDTSSAADISANGRYALFTSYATNLLPNTTLGGGHIYRRDLGQGVTELVDAAGAAGVPNGSILGQVYLSSNGRYSAFTSTATNLVAGDTNGINDVFLRDIEQQTTELVNVATDGTQANNWSGLAGLSADGRYVLFQSAATNLIPDGTVPGVRNIYLRDRLLQTTGLVVEIPQSSIAPAWFPFLSPDGGFAAYDFNLPVPAGGPQWTSIRHDLQTGATESASVSSDEQPANAPTYTAAVSRNGRVLLMSSAATNLVDDDTNGATDVFVRNTVQGTTTRVSVAHDGAEANQGSAPLGISANGRYVAFRSPATNLVPGDTNGVMDVFVRDRSAGTTTRVNLAADGSQANADARDGRISANAEFVIFSSAATNLVDGDTNGRPDVFVRNLITDTTTRVSVG